jgi:hypothetical protein
MSPPKKLTLDTNCLINYFDPSSKTATSLDALGELIRYATTGQAEIAITTRAESDIEQDKDEARKASMLRHLAMFKVIGTVLRWDESKWDAGDVWADDESVALTDEVQNILFPGLQSSDKRFGNKIRDIDHIVGHILDRRDVFITDDGHLNARAGELRKLGAMILRPAECLAFLRDLDARQTPKALTTDALNPEYHANGHSGEVTFDYSNNNGRYVIGDGLFLFETCWSKSSDADIIAYSDPVSIDAIALAKGVAAISEIKDATNYDFSSRVRRPKVGEVVIWRNANGLYAATQVQKITDDSRGGATEDSLSFAYLILDKGADFAAVKG